MMIFVFAMHPVIYGVEAEVVREVIALPEITPIDEAPGYVVGVINLRDHVVPVIDIRIRMGRQPERYRLSDAVVILERDGRSVGVVVNEVLEMREIDSS